MNVQRVKPPVNRCTVCSKIIFLCVYGAGYLLTIPVASLGAFTFLKQEKGIKNREHGACNDANECDPRVGRAARSTTTMPAMPV